MNLLFDNIIFSKERQGGISKYWGELISSYSNDGNAAFYEEASATENIYRKEITLKNLVPHRQIPELAARMLPVFYRTDKDYLLYHSSFYRKLITKADICEVATVHDFIHDYYFPLHKRLLHNHLKYSSIERSKGIICVSENTRRDLLKFCGKRMDQEVAVIHNGVNDEFNPIDINTAANQSIIKALNLNDRKFLLFVGSRAHYKNFGFVLSLLGALDGYKLVVVGNPLQETEKKAIGSELLKKVIVKSNIANSTLNLLYNMAHALVYPSDYEGFGIPLIEAMKAGCPVLALDRSSIPEIAGEGGILLPEKEIMAFKNKVTQLESLYFREQIVQAGIENARRFSWNKCIKETRSFYESIY